MPALRLLDLVTCYPDDGKKEIFRLEKLAKISFLSFENEIRSMAELSLRRIFCSFPGSLINEVAANNMRKAYKLCDSYGSNKIKPPLIGSMRPLPKGAAGVQCQKPLHDDGNSGIAPGIWTGVTGCSAGSESVLRFATPNGIVSIDITEKRQVLFLGWLPHLTENKKAHIFQGGKGFGDGEWRFHHSAFMKVEQEFIALVLFGDDDRAHKSVSSYKWKQLYIN